MRDIESLALVGSHSRRTGLDPGPANERNSRDQDRSQVLTRRKRRPGNPGQNNFVVCRPLSATCEVNTGPWVGGSVLIARDLHADARLDVRGKRLDPEVFARKMDEAERSGVRS